jgi:hypothetical protein
MKPTYFGPALECGKTSIVSAAPTPALKWLVQLGVLVPNMTVLDYGAGKTARNTKYLRRLGFDVTAVDPFHHSKRLGILDPGQIQGYRFDVALTSYVLNVVPEYIEDDILNKLDTLTDQQIHITRGTDLVQLLRGLKPNSYTYKWIKQNAIGCGIDRAVQSLTTTKYATALETLAHFGFATTRGFQRLPSLERKGFSLIAFNSNRVYIKRP